MIKPVLTTKTNPAGREYPVLLHGETTEELWVDDKEKALKEGDKVRLVTRDWAESKCGAEFLPACQGLKAYTDPDQESKRTIIAEMFPLLGQEVTIDKVRQAPIFVRDLIGEDLTHIHIKELADVSIANWMLQQHPSEKGPK